MTAPLTWAESLRARLVQDGDSRRRYSKLRIRAGFVLAVLALVFCRPPFRWGFLVVCALGLALRAWSAGCLLKNRELCTSGPYGVIRHPLYAGSFVLGLGGLLTMRCSWLVLVYLLGFGAIYTMTMLVEEDKLARRFPAEYPGYMARTGRWLPRWGFWRWIELGGWSWERYVRNREYRSLLGLAGFIGVLLLRQNWM
jgi:protein-S-isoprenylcysteine O-methyltransferase Ste14